MGAKKNIPYVFGQVTWNGNRRRNGNGNEDEVEEEKQTNQRAVGKFESELFTFVSVACR